MYYLIISKGLHTHTHTQFGFYVTVMTVTEISYNKHLASILLNQNVKNQYADAKYNFHEAKKCSG